MWMYDDLGEMYGIMFKHVTQVKIKYKIVFFFALLVSEPLFFILELIFSLVGSNEKTCRLCTFGAK